MKKLFGKFEFAAPVVAAITMVALTSVTVFAGPGGVPPNGNIDANFSSVSGGKGAAADMGVGGDFVGGNTGVQGVGNGPAGVGGLFSGKNGVVVNSTTGDAGQFTSTGAAGGLFNGAGYGVVGNGTTPWVGTGGQFTGTGYGVIGISSTPGGGAAGSFQGTATGIYSSASDATGKGGSFFGKGMGLVSHTDPGGIAGNFFSTKGCGSSTLLGTDNYAFGVLGCGWDPDNPTFQIDNNGNLSSNGHIKAASIGTYGPGFLNIGPNKNAGETTALDAACPVGSFVVSCGFLGGSGNWNIKELYINANACHLFAVNLGPGAGSQNLLPSCFNPNL